jgi:hypothetical protein
MGTENGDQRRHEESGLCFESLRDLTRNKPSPPTEAVAISLQDAARRHGDRGHVRCAEPSAAAAVGLVMPAKVASGESSAVLAIVIGSAIVSFLCCRMRDRWAKLSDSVENPSSDLKRGDIEDEVGAHRVGHVAPSRSIVRPIAQPQPNRELWEALVWRIAPRASVLHISPTPDMVNLS